MDINLGSQTCLSVTAVIVDKDKHTIMIACLNDPQDVQMPIHYVSNSVSTLRGRPFNALR